ncbi:CRISPR-associated protein, Cas5d family [Saccharopolyspora shandongensis]|uniref:pre-crRNA processing endonuclease n=1 Tax=Saccharopolyspora shandongensis TaxID=418495 RepID=A0A1H3TLG8_9PSEU|nr:type I-C CRISPR-associated protein Cas5c [Saccharopolyspora shandongensis]SDZ50837.1 CRISPR-associated protein, Cas5d family [Saccharopolyspora shandongensis]
MTTTTSPDARRNGPTPVVVEVWGDGALFTNPALKTERVTYPVMTPSAAVGVLESIFWKPEIRWRIEYIEVLKPIQQFTLRRNETTDLVSLVDAARGQRRVDTVENRVQRNAVCLRDVRYRIHAQVELNPRATKPAAAYRDQFRRRVESGRCFAQPYLGTREFTAYFSTPTDHEPLPFSSYLGWMLHTVDHATTPPSFTWFEAELRNGVLEVPEVGVSELGEVTS